MLITAKLQLADGYLMLKAAMIYVTDPFLIWTLQLVLTTEYVHTKTLCGCFRLLYWKPPPRLSNSFSSRKRENSANEIGLRSTVG